MRYENKTEPRMARPEPTVPQEPGYYWAKWRIPEDGTADEDRFVFVDKWEAVEVHHDFTETGADFLVSVAGVAHPQSVENFVWSKPVRPIPVPA